MVGIHYDIVGVHALTEVSKKGFVSGWVKNQYGDQSNRMRATQSTMKNNNAAAGRLDGMTILRYAHAHDKGGGVEQYLSDLNRGLLERNRMTIIQVQLTSDPERVGEEESQIGIGVFVRSALLVPPGFGAQGATDARLKRGSVKTNRYKQWAINNVIFTPPLYPWLSRFWLRKRLSRSRNGEPNPNDARNLLRSLNKRFSTDLMCLHIAGCADTAEVLDAADTFGIPTAAVHHFSNEKLAQVAVRAQIRQMDGVAGVNALGVPKFLRAKFVNVSDGIDTDFFRRENAQVPLVSAVPIVFLPARFTPTKGQADVVRAVAALKRRGLNLGCVFAGRVDQPAFFNEVRALVRQEGLENAVRFVGELGPAELRDWYSIARVVAFPTRHCEGLPRILLESQAMGVPPVIYDTGGTSEGIRHGETGFLLKVGDMEGLVESIERLVNDDALHRRMALAGRETVERRFTIQRLCERHENFYVRVVETFGSKKGFALRNR